MVLSSRSRVPPALAGAVVALGVLLAVAPAGAGVRSSTVVEGYRVGGSTPAGLVSFMRNHPYSADNGDAVAHITPNYSLAIGTKEAGGVCRPSRVDLNVRFDMVLPKATDAAAMSSVTLAAWNSFAAFARQHEETHRTIYLQCASDFVTKAMRVAAGSCISLEANIRSLLESEKRACDLRQNAFDRVQYGLVLQQNLFALASYSGRKPVQVAPVSGPSSALVAPR
jgi:predicted secreted Zn-dependent protease